MGYLQAHRTLLQPANYTSDIIINTYKNNHVVPDWYYKQKKNALVKNKVSYPTLNIRQLYV